MKHAYEGPHGNRYVRVDRGAGGYTVRVTTGRTPAGKTIVTETYPPEPGLNSAVNRALLASGHDR